MEITERQTGRRYRLIKRYTDAGRFMEAGTLRRYEVFKQYV